ncbi:MAG: hypothetical protein GWO04_04665, partial [Actinobacteria bacterium]|nr:hypothetical protein [Actinomycetota bacterium]
PDDELPEDELEPETVEPSPEQHTIWAGISDSSRVVQYDAFVVGHPGSQKRRS